MHIESASVDAYANVEYALGRDIKRTEQISMSLVQSFQGAFVRRSRFVGPVFKRVSGGKLAAGVGRMYIHGGRDRSRTFACAFYLPLKVYHGDASASTE